MEVIAGIILLIAAIFVAGYALIFVAIAAPILLLVHFAIQDTLHGTMVVGALILVGLFLLMPKK
jgi:hypothetical protein